MTVPEWRAADPGGIYVGRDEGLGKFMLSRLDLASGEMVDIVVREDDATAELAAALARRDAGGVRPGHPRGRQAVGALRRGSGDRQGTPTHAIRLHPRPARLDAGIARIVFDSPGLGVYNDGDAEAANLWVVDADGRNLAQFTHYTEDNGGATQPHVLADGSGIAFTKVLDGTLLRPMGLVDIDGSNDRFLTPNQSRGSRLIRPLP